MARSSSSSLVSCTGPNDALFDRYHINSRTWKPKSQQEAEHRQLKAWAKEQQVPEKQSTEARLLRLCDLKVTQEQKSPSSWTSCEKGMAINRDLICSLHKKKKRHLS